MENVIKNKRTERNSNYELMRIISMIFIILFHILVHGKILEHATGAREIVLVIVESILLVHVNSFILLTGYFQSERKIKVGKIISLVNMVWFYKVIIMFILIGIGLITRPDSVTLIQTIFPLDFGTYWYIGCFLVLYLISPILNKIINNSTKKENRNTIIILFFIVSILSSISNDVYFNSYSGRSVGTFILLYLIGAYIKKYPFENSYFVRPFTKETRQLLYLGMFFLLAGVSTVSWMIMSVFREYGPVVSMIGNIFGTFHISFASPIIILQSIMYFLFFGTLNVKSKIINKIGGCALASYLITENIFVRSTIYNVTGLTEITNIGMKLLIIVTVISIVLFILCTCIELVRKKIFKFIYNRKISSKLREKYRGYLARLGFNINW